MGFVFTRMDINDVILVEPKVFGDERGFFMETYSRSDFVEAGIDSIFVQDNHSMSSKGVLRGFHFQTHHTQAKLVRVTRGAVLDFAIDIRKDSPDYGKYVMHKLTGKNKQQLFIPKGFAHGFLTLEDHTEFLYKCDDVYSPLHEGGILWNDTEIGIDWEKIKDQYAIQEFILSDKDKNNLTLEEFYSKNPF